MATVMYINIYMPSGLSQCVFITDENCIPNESIYVKKRIENLLSFNTIQLSAAAV